MTRQDRALAVGCAVIRLWAMVSLSTKAWTHPALPTALAEAAAGPNLQSARVHSLAGASAQAVSLF